MDRRHRIELQIRAVLITYRGERRRHDSGVMEEFRDRAEALLHGLDPLVERYPDLRQRLAEARLELAGKRPNDGLAR